MTEVIGMPILEYYLLIIFGIASPIIFIIAYLQVRKTVPWAFTMYNAFKENMPIAWKHGGKSHSQIEVPEIDKEIRTDKGIPITYYRIKKWGLKFTETAIDQAELLEGKVKVIHFFRNYTRPLSIIEVKAMYDLAEWFKDKGLNITNYEDIIFTLLADDKNREQVVSELTKSVTESEETKEMVIKAFDLLKANYNEVKRMTLRDGIFTFDTAMNAIDKSLAYTSSDLARTKVAIEANEAVKHNEDKDKNLYRTVLVISVLLVCAAVAYSIISKSGAL